MRFQVVRSSEGAVSKRPPCKGATRGPESSAFPGEFEWYIELTSLEALVQFLEANGGGLGLWTPEPGEECPVIEIVDEE